MSNFSFAGTQKKAEYIKCNKKNEKTIFLPIRFINKELLLINRITEYPDKFFYYGSAGMYINNQVILKFEREAGFLKLIQLQYRNQVDKKDVIANSVLQNHKNPVFAYIPILKDNKDGVVVSSKFFEQELNLFDFVSESRKSKYKLVPSKNHILFKNSKLDKSSLLINREINYSAEKSPKTHYSNHITISQLLAFRILPEKVMKARKWNPRVGIFESYVKIYNSNKLNIEKYYFMDRWKLEPEDKDAYLSGQLSKPKEPIVYYLSNDIPNKWRNYISRGVQAWNPVFEKIGFKDVLIVKQKPDDAKWSDNNPNYNVIRWVASEIKDAQGNYIIDPRSGQILNSMLIWYQNYLAEINNEYFVMAAATDERARKPILDDELIGEIMQEVMTHEMGHALGLGHNMISSSSYSTDSLRSASFVNKYSLAASIMDYSSFNYIAQPEDMPVSLTRKIGPYDYWAIEFAYKYYNYDNFETDTDEIMFHNERVNKATQNKKLEYMEQEYGKYIDPTNGTGDLGDDAIKSAEYAIKNLQIIMPNFVKWSLLPTGETYIVKERYEVLKRHLFDLFKQIVMQVGGQVNRKEDNKYKSTMINSQQSIAAVSYLVENLFRNMSWLFNEDLENLDENDYYKSSLIELQTYVIKRLLEKDRLLRIIAQDIKENKVTTNNILRILSNSIVKTSLVNELDFKVQKYYVDKIGDLIKDSSEDLILLHILKEEKDYVKKCLEERVKKEKNQIVKGFYLELLEV